MATDPAPQAPSTPEFDRQFASLETFYFYHVVDAERATLQSQVLGPNVSNTFFHGPAMAHCTQSHIEDALVRKTTGFLTLLQPGTSPSRTILAWAESGHGHNPRGDFLESTSSVLANKRWTSRVMKLAKEMGINMGHPYDALARGGKVGMFRASHVEVKLAVHAVYILLKMAALPTERVTRADLTSLRGRAWRGGARPRFEIYFSKRNCRGCAEYVRQLEDLTGAEIKLLWKQRLVKIDYGTSKMGPADAQQEAIPVEEEAEEDVVNVDLSDDSDEVSDVVEVTPEPLGAYVNGLAYCIGQRGDRGRATRAVVGLARIWKRQAATRANARRRRQHGRDERGRGQPTGGRRWLATPPASSGLESRGAAKEGVVARERSPRQYSFVCRDSLSLGR